MNSDKWHCVETATHGEWNDTCVEVSWNYYWQQSKEIKTTGLVILHVLELNTRQEPAGVFTNPCMIYKGDVIPLKNISFVFRSCFQNRQKVFMSKNGIKHNQSTMFVALSCLLVKQRVLLIMNPSLFVMNYSCKLGQEKQQMLLWFIRKSLLLLISEIVKTGHNKSAVW